jgi:carboxyl-terminal processing protease
MATRLRGFLLLGVGIGAVIAVIRLVTAPSPRLAEADVPVVEGTRLFQTVFDHVQSFAVDSLGAQELYRRAAAGLLEELDDPYAQLIPPGQQATSPDSVAPQGVFLDRRDEVAVVVATVPGSPADSAGIAAGDVLLAVDSTPVDPARLERAARLLEGTPGTRATLRVRRPGVRGVTAIELIRGPVPRSPAVQGSILAGQIAYIGVRRFEAGIADSVRRVLSGLVEQGARALVLDFRGVVGGTLHDGAALADLFLGPGNTLAVSRGRSGTASSTIADSSGSAFEALPIAVLVSRGTAGAAEVAAGALQDHDRAALLGAATFGRGVSQSTFPLGEGVMLRLTTALWMTPSGRQIQRPPRARADSADAPTVRTDAGRTLPAGGGIVPDRVVSDTGAADLPLAAARRLLARATSPKSVLGLLER